VIRKIVKRLADRQNGAGIYRRFAKPDGYEWAEYLRAHGNVYHVGEGCTISPDAKILDPVYTWIGNRVCIASCTLICHDGSVEILNQRYGVRLDRVAPIIIHDDVFVGESAIILPGVTVGEGSIIGAGAVVRQSIPAGSVVVGNPAKVVAKVADVVRLWEADTLSLPWADLIEKRIGVYDAAMEPELIRRRQEHFFKGDLRRPQK
jgi:acetyltransferase-like isoleucine patch superfamily enzyme